MVGRVADSVIMVEFGSSFGKRFFIRIWDPYPIISFSIPNTALLCMVGRVADPDSVIIVVFGSNFGKKDFLNTELNSAVDRIRIREYPLKSLILL